MILLGFDFGTRKIGLATGQDITRTATSLGVVPAREGVPDWQALEKIISQWKPDAFVVGMPYNMDGSENEMTARARKFVRQLEGRFNRPCHIVDERLSSREARDIYKTGRLEAGRRYNAMEEVDALAAQLILETWLAENT